MTAPHTHEFDLTKLLSGPHYCTACAERVCAAVSAFDDVEDVQCDLAGGTFAVVHRSRGVGRDDLESRVARAALEASGSVAHAAYRLTGLD